MRKLKRMTYRAAPMLAALSVLGIYMYHHA
jgi:hypothetical protein